MKTLLKSEFAAVQTLSRHLDSFSVSLCLMASWSLGLQPRDKAAMVGVNTIEFFLEEFTWK